ncbi:hypothetical protein RJ640_027032 [Escallonia rubra]|uniref:Helicase MAGATAMA 3 n=1 Tax=Escallonia rubra TaxID=112253 RepID=A0AA88U3K1_9ASTE|nr:hypothetical protein RJ640_027032 [Escallonia rubra]
MKSFIYPLIEETRADLSSHMATLSRAPICQIFDVTISDDHKPPKDLYYNLSPMEVRYTQNGEVEYEPEVGDLIALTDVRPKCVNDLNRPKTPYLLAFVQGKSAFPDEFPHDLLILSSKPIVYEKNEQERGMLFAVSLTNLTTNIRIWNALNLDPEGTNTNIIRKVLQPSHAVDGNCTLCSPETIRGFPIANLREAIRQFIKLDDSQEAAVLSCIATRECHHQNGVKLIWGPPGTGKTKTVASLLFALLRMKCRTLTCAPTNIAILGVAARFMGLVQDTLKYDTYGLGDVLLFGNGKRMKIQDCKELHDIFLSKRAASLAACFAPFSGWKGSIDSIILLFEDPEELYILYLEKKLKGKDSKDDNGEDDFGDGFPGKGILSQIPDEEEELKDEETLKGNIKKIVKEPSKKGKEMSGQEGGGSDDADAAEKVLTFEEFLVKRFLDIGEKLTNLAKTLIGVNGLLQTLLHNVAVIDEGLSEGDNGVEEAKKNITKLSMCRTDFLEILKTLRETVSLPDFTEERTIRDFCIRHATLIFCTVSSSAKLHAEGMTPLELLVIDEAAQLKECESTIPLQLSGLRHAILVGDERQLPAMVQSKICVNVEFGRSLFERLVLLGHGKHLLNVQYRMHPSISLFPNEEFYDKQISDGPNVKERTYEMRFLNGNIFGSYSFINVAKGREEFGNGHSPRNMMEVAVVAEIVAGLYKESVARKQRLSVGCISPYNAQVFAIQEKLGKSDEFCNSRFRIKHVDIRQKVVSILLELSNGWRQPSREKTNTNMAGVSSQLLEQYNVNGYLSLIWSVDVHKEASMHIQVIVFWDILPVCKIPDVSSHLNIRFGNYTPNTIKLCKYRRVEGKLVLPMTWPLDSDALTLASYDPSESLASQLERALEGHSFAQRERKREREGGKRPTGAAAEPVAAMMRAVAD